mgnify:CR=1 FL=1
MPLDKKLFNKCYGIAFKLYSDPKAVGIQHLALESYLISKGAKPSYFLHGNYDNSKFDVLKKIPNVDVAHSSQGHSVIFNTKYSEKIFSILNKPETLSRYGYANNPVKKLKGLSPNGIYYTVSYDIEDFAHILDGTSRTYPSSKKIQERLDAIYKVVDSPVTLVIKRTERRFLDSAYL